MNDYTLYILMRNDLPSMSTGRAMAQASHASNAFIHSVSKNKPKSVKGWQEQTTQGFGTAIVLAANLHTISAVFSDIQDFKNLRGIYHNELFLDWVVDPEYGFRTNTEIYKLIHPNLIQESKTIVDGNNVTVFKREYTCGYVFGSKELLRPFLGALPLHP